jgi:hypothetical protein
MVQYLIMMQLPSIGKIMTYIFVRAVVSEGTSHWLSLCVVLHLYDPLLALFGCAGAVLEQTRSSPPFTPSGPPAMASIPSSSVNVPLGEPPARKRKEGSRCQIRGRTEIFESKFILHSIGRVAVDFLCLWLNQQTSAASRVCNVTHYLLCQGFGASKTIVKMVDIALVNGPLSIRRSLLMSKRRDVDVFLHERRR